MVLGGLENKTMFWNRLKNLFYINDYVMIRIFEGFQKRRAVKHGFVWYADLYDKYLALLPKGLIDYSEQSGYYKYWLPITPRMFEVYKYGMLESDLDKIEGVEIRGN